MLHNFFAKQPLLPLEQAHPARARQNGIESVYVV
jgi:hypothetical protein